uniref:Rab-GAP TBC domain-containing protein n=1 Tax=Panagrolaimus sp. JU765 TaxID=591449 RepID=A0AC34RI87_9BILA
MESENIENGQQRNTFLNQWNNLLDNLNDLDAMKSYAFQGGLRDSAVRTIYWRVMLGCLSRDQSQWLSTIKKDREFYENLKKESEKIPDQEDVFGLSLDINNPLSLEADSPWNQYFADANLKETIEKDVDRTFPEINYFNDENVKEMMKNVLFIYSKRNSQLSYRQGMHEILAPILFTLHYDHCSYEDGDKSDITIFDNNNRSLLDYLNDNRYIEHDAYTIFCKVMSIIGQFYGTADELDEDQNIYFNFVYESSKKIRTAWVEKLDLIFDVRLKEIDRQLWNHLRNLDISPRLFGLRWLRLLFGREFPFHDLLFFWDVIFSDEPSFKIIDDIFLAMLVQLRRLLLAADYSTAMHFLMRYPPIDDVQNFINFCLHLRFPHRFSKPLDYAVSNYSHITVAGKPHPNQERKEKRLTNGEVQMNPITEYPSLHFTPTKNPQIDPLIWSTSTVRTTEEMVEELELLKEQVALLQSNLNDKDLTSRISSSRLVKLIPEIEESLTEPSKISKIIDEIRDIAQNLSKSTTTQKWIRIVSKPEQHALKILDISKDNGIKFRPRSQSGSNTKSQLRVTPRSLRNENELKELHFGMKKNF